MLINFTNLELSNVWNTECLPHGVVGMVAGQRGSLLHQQLLQGDLLPDPVSSNTMVFVIGKKRGLHTLTAV